ncbi:hypothetical protein Syun_017404 [Stephania yunnanensis]|uniref:Protein kinase domain-containing protein n=1 Tax=Stephania yunnanensis TaxID=152371 RepID=A0AAP0J6H3_9MAGN
MVVGEETGKGKEKVWCGWETKSRRVMVGGGGSAAMGRGRDEHRWEDERRGFSDHGLPESDVKSFTNSILLDIHYIHEKGFAHLDINPNNILLVPRYSSNKKRTADPFVAEIADFKTAKSFSQISAEQQQRKDWWFLRGTLGYMSPELIAECEKGTAGDIWGLGCVVVEMLCGQPAFSIKPGERMDEFLYRMGFGDDSPRLPDNGVSEEALDFLKRCFVRDSKLRWDAASLLSHPFLQDFKDISNTQVGLAEEGPIM